MRLQQRLNALEQRSPSETGVTLIVRNVFRQTPDGTPLGDPVIAHVLGSRRQAGVSLRREENEAADMFKARAEAEHRRMHSGSVKRDPGPLPYT